MCCAADSKFDLLVHTAREKKNNWWLDGVASCQCVIDKGRYESAD
jgi:hypothetical protein